MTFNVDRMPIVDKQIRELAERAKARRIRGAYLDALTSMIDNLSMRPLEWGDPQYHTKTPGGLVCQRVVWPICVRYVVFMTHQVAIISDIAAVPSSPLANE